MQLVDFISNEIGFLMGPFRVLMLCAFVAYVLTLKNFANRSAFDLSSGAIALGFYFSTVILLAHLLVMANMFDRFTVYFIFFFIIFIAPSLKLQSYFRLLRQGKYSLRATSSEQFNSLYDQLLEFYKKLKRFRWLVVVQKHFQKKSILFFSIFISALIMMFIRMSFIENDLYTLSKLWVKEINVLNELNNSLPFSTTSGLFGEYLSIHLYAKLTGLNINLAVISFGLIEFFFLGGMLYWFIKEVSNSKYTIPLICMLLLAVGFRYLPFNLNLLLKHQSEYLGFLLLLPLFYLLLWNPMHHVLQRNKTLKISLWVLALFTINFFVAFYVLPVFLICATLIQSNNRILHGQMWKAYIYGLFVFSIFIYGYSSINQFSIAEFFMNNWIQIDSYSYFPQMRFEVSDFLFGAVLISTLGFTISLVAYYIDKSRSSLLVLALSILVIISGCFLFESYFDLDVLFILLPLFTVLELSILFTALKWFFDTVIKKPAISYAIGMIAISTATYLLISSLYSIEIEKKTPLKKDILSVYTELFLTNFPYTYSVVNNKYAEPMSQGSHFYMNYEEFSSDYISKDSIYYQNREDENYLKSNPEVIPTNTYYIFIPKSENEDDELFNVNVLTQNKIQSTLRDLKKKGRSIRTYYESENLSVYELTNKSNATKINDILLSREN